MDHKPNLMVEEYQAKWNKRTRLVDKTTEVAIKKYITRNQSVSQRPIYYGWHPTDGFVAYLDDSAAPSHLVGIEEYQHVWRSRNTLTCRATESGIRNFISKYPQSAGKPIYYDWHPVDGFVAYTTIKD